MSDLHETDVLIVGGGPAGASLAYLLARNGLSVLLLERHKDFERAFRGEALMPGGRAMVEQMGLAPAFSQVPQAQVREVEMWLGASRLIEITPPGAPDTLPLMISQPHFLQMFCDAASDHSGFELWMGAQFHGFVEQDGRITGAHVHIDGETREVRARLVVGTDGRSSATLKQSGLPAKQIARQDFDVFWARFPFPQALSPDRAFGVISDRALTLGFRNAFGDLQLAAVIDKGGFGDIRARGMDQWVEELAHRMPPYLETHLRDNWDAMTGFTVLNVQANCASTWSRPGFLLLGDAAHTMSPVGAQGINVALRDAVVAANHLVPALRISDTAVDLACLGIQGERMQEIVPCQRQQAALPRLLRSRPYVMGLVRFLAPMVIGQPFVQRRVLPVAQRFINGFTDVTLEV